MKKTKLMQGDRDIRMASDLARVKLSGGGTYSIGHRQAGIHCHVIAVSVANRAESSRFRGVSSRVQKVPRPT